MKSKRKLLVICPFPQGVAAGQRLKYEQYFDHWRSEGFTIKVSSFMDLAMWKIVYSKGKNIGKIIGTIRGFIRTWLTVCTVPFYDGVYIFMYVAPIGTSLPERVTRLLAKKIVLDIEDNVMGEQKVGMNFITRLLRSKGKFDYLIRKADHVITSSSFLNDDCLKANEKGKCTYISSSMDTARFTVVNEYNNNDKVVIGWTGTFSSSVYLDLLRPVFLELKKQRDFKLLVIGNFEYDFPEMDLEVIQWTAKDEVTDLQRFDIGVYPLPFDDWVLGKSGLKAIQYMTIGIPAVATNVGTSPMLITNMENGCLVKTEEDWVSTLKFLIDNPETRKVIGTAARKTILEKYSKEAIKHQYLDVLNSTIKNR
ncbi:MAG: glycosyltransferase [Chitinophagaceae bacterium]